MTRLLCRFYDADAGRVLIDGVDVRYLQTYSYLLKAATYSY